MIGRVLPSGRVQQDPPWLLGAFKLTEKRSESAVGAIYRAEMHGRRSHIRILARSYASDPEAIALVLAHAGRSPIQHPNIGGGCCYVPEIARGCVDGVVFLACSPANDLDLETLVHQRGALPWPEVRRILLDVCRGLDAAHRDGHVHGDLQAGHCFHIDLDALDLPPVVRVTGFGLAAARHRGLRSDRPVPPAMPPEQLAGAPPDRRSDVFAAGVLLEHLVTGVPPAPRLAPASEQYRRDAATSGPTPCPPQVQAIVERALDPDPDARYPTMRELAAAIAAVDGGDVAAAMAAHNPSPRYLERSRPSSSPLMIVVLAALGAGLLRMCTGPW